MMNSKIELINWDSKFFKKEIGKINISNIEEFPNDQLKSFDLVYVFSQNDNLDFKLIDKKIVYLIENIEKTENEMLDVQFYNSDIDKYEELLLLTLQSGEYSRFKLDENFKNNEYEKLYKEWIDKSISKDLAFEIIVKKIEDKIVGFTTLAKKSDELADISLVAVDSNYRGKGIALELIKKSIEVAKQKNFKKIQVVTQLDNEPANKLYLKAGFKEESITYIYHVWNYDTI